jgi:hypothetical protein
LVPSGGGGRLGGLLLLPLSLVLVLLRLLTGAGRRGWLWRRAVLLLLW